MPRVQSIFRDHWFRFLLVLGALLLILVVWALANSNKAATNAPNPVTTHVHQPTSTTAPDPVKTDTGNNGDTTPSPTGTGQGSSNSLLGQ